MGAVPRAEDSQLVTTAPLILQILQLKDSRNKRRGMSQGCQQLSHMNAVHFVTGMRSFLSFAGLDVGPQHLRTSNSSWLKDGGHAQAIAEQQQQQQQQQRDFLQRPTASKAPTGGAPMRQLEVLPAMKLSTSADSLAPVPHDDVRFLHDSHQ